MASRWRALPWVLSALPRGDKQPWLTLLSWQECAGELARDASPLQRRRGLDELDRECGEAMAGRPHSAIGQALRSTAGRYNLEPSPFRASLRAWELEATTPSFPTVKELTRHAQALQSAWVHAFPRILGRDAEQHRVLARSLGEGVQLTRWMARYHLDFAQGRLRIASEDLAAAGVSIEALLEHRSTPGTPALIDEQVRRARSALAKGWPLVREADARRGRVLAFCLRWHAATCGALENQRTGGLGAPLPAGALRFGACLLVSAMHRGSPFG